MTLATIVRYWGRQKPDACAVSTTVDTSWAQLDGSTDALAAGLEGIGVRHGDRIAIVAGNGLAYCHLMIAAFKLGAIFVPLNARLTAAEISYLLEACSPRIVIADPHHEAVVQSALSRLPQSPRPKLVRMANADGGGELQDLFQKNALPPSASVSADDVAVLCYTSGTTGQPKGAMLTHGNLWAMATARVLISEMTHRDIGYLPFSLSFAGGIAGVYIPHYFVGARIILDDEFDATRTLNTIQDERVTVFSAVPVIWEKLTGHPEFSAFDLSSLRSCFSGGAPVSLSLLETLQAAGIPMAQAYGITEASALGSVLGADAARRKLGSAGLPILQSEIRIADEQQHPLPCGEVGELLIRGPHVMKGYWNDPAATADTLVDGWLRTGDLATMDAEGYITIVDRAKDMIITGGLNVYPAEIEKVLAGLPGVVEVAVFGAPDPKWSETVVAVLVTDRVVEPAAVAAICREQLADYKRPRHLILRANNMPRSTSGKILKRLLKSEYDTAPATGILLKY